MTVQQAYHELSTQLQNIYDEAEAGNISEIVIEYVTGKQRLDRMLNKEHLLTANELEQLNTITQKLLRNIPVQYALSEAWFAGMKLFVNENVLIPRPETEELVEWIIQEVAGKQSEIRNILDIGTGSGCIPISIKKKLPKLNVKAIDVSEGALNVAVKNAMLQAVQVYFIRMDFLKQQNWIHLGKFDIIISNPPYIKKSEASSMHQNVLDHEPHLALFVPDEDALLFYRNIAAFGKTHLETNGMIFLEINETLGKEVVALFTQQGYSTELKKDMQGKDRMLKAINNKL